MKMTSYEEIDEVAIYEARYMNVDDIWEYYPEDQMAVGLMSVLNGREVDSIDIRYQGDLIVRWRKRMVSNDIAFDMHEEYLNTLLERENR